ncbi:hypothetical protein VTI74DRAFT_2738 [Chaetomium olivicolor]
MADQEDPQSFERTIAVSAIDPALEGVEFDDLIPQPSLDDDLPPEDAPLSFPSLDQVRDSSVPRDQSALSRKRAYSTDFSTASNDNKKQKATPLLKRVPFSRPMTDQIMVWFEACRKRGLFNSTRKKDYGPVWAEVLGYCQERWPRYPWTKQSISSKYDNERRRFQQWKMLVDGYSGVTYNYETGLPYMSDSTWELFVKRHNTNSKSVVWLRTVPLGDVEIYRSVFFRERASGRYIAEIDDAIDTQSTTVVDLESDDSGRDDPIQLDPESDSDIEDSAVQTPVPSKRRLTAMQRRRIETDPDQTPASDSSATINIPAHKMSHNKRIQERDSTILANSFLETAMVLAAPRLPSADDVALAVEDIQKLFADVVDDDELLNCIEYLQGNPMRAVIWNKLGLSLKKKYIDK